ncbi:MAG: hypothetical protein WBE90_01745 [Xanthobacteraceae bacterium]
MLATAKIRQRPDAARMTGNNRPSCGFKVRSPIRRAATTGLRSSSAMIASSTAAVTNELCPEIKQKTTAGENKIAMNSLLSSRPWWRI